METIIQQITLQFVKKYLEHFEQKGLYELGQMASDSLDMSKALSKELITAFIEHADKQLVEAKKERKSDGITIHEREVTRSIYTSLGEISFARTYFQTPEGPDYLLDQILGIKAYERVDTHISAKMVNAAAEASFGKSAKLATEGKLSRQTAWRKTAEVGEVAILPLREKETPKALHIFADEDHVNLQSGSNTILPLITVCKGKRKVCKGRHELLDPVHINGYGLTPEKRWEYVYSLCASKYDMEKVEEIYIYGDAAAWIESANTCFPTAIYVMDAYHFRKTMKILTAGTICSNYSQRLYSGVKYNKKKKVQIALEEMIENLLELMPEGKAKENKIQAIADAGVYILNYWKAIQNMKLPGTIGSATEALVSHIFSERFSRNPMGWSKKGLQKLSMVRIFVKNGGKVLPVDIGKGKQDVKERIPKTQVCKYEELVKKQQEEIFSESKNWRWFEHETLTVSPSGTKVSLDSLGKRRRIA